MLGDFASGHSQLSTNLTVYMEPGKHLQNKRIVTSKCGLDVSIKCKPVFSPSFGKRGWGGIFSSNKKGQTYKKNKLTF